MEVECETKHYEKLFGNCLVTWKIDDFCLFTCRNNYRIHSSDFCVTGPETTKWKFIFIPKPSNLFCMELILKRLCDNAPFKVHVSWSITVLVLDEECFYSEYLYEFKKETEKKIEICNLSDVLSAFHPFRCDTLIIRCHLIIQHGYVNTEWDKPTKNGLICLSKDLQLMLKSGQNKDITFKVGEGEISGHKAILCRNVVLDQIITETSNNSIEFPDLNIEAVRRFIDFMYTGDLNDILQNPSLAMHKCLEVMDKDLLRCYFALEELCLNTKINTQELEHLWIIPNFSGRKRGAISPPFKRLNVDTTWQLQIHLNDVNNIHYLSITANIVRGKIPPNLCVEFAAEDSERETYYPNRILSSIESPELRLKEFIKIDCLEGTSLLIEDTLRLVFRARTWDGDDHFSRSGSRMMLFVVKSNESTHENLSRSMLSLLKTGTASDISVQVESTIFRVHRCILSARSPVLSRMIKELKDDFVIILKDITSSVLRILIEYIYSGVLPEVAQEELVLLLKAAKTYRIPSLEEECQQILQTLSGRDDVISLIEEQENKS